MAPHRIERWFQFGILDLLILTTVAAIVALLGRPTEANRRSGLPWLVGRWDAEGSMLLLYPDGVYYASTEGDEDRRGKGWIVRQVNMGGYSCVLECGDQRFAIRDLQDGVVVDWLTRSGRVHSRLTQTECLCGPTRCGRPHGTWRDVFELPDTPASLEYENGDLVDAHTRYGSRDFALLDTVRDIRGLPMLTARDFRKGNCEGN